jgi:hypothetical protein
MTQEKKPSIIDRAKAFIHPPRAEETYTRLHKEAGFIPLLNMTDTESRRVEIKAMLDECKASLFEPDSQKKVVKSVYALFFSAGVPWYRGLDNRELARKVEFFHENYTQAGYMDEFIPDLYEEAVELLSLSWQSLDVTQTPVYLIESRPVIDMKGGRGAPEGSLDSTGLAEIQEEIERLKEEAKKKK